MDTPPLPLTASFNVQPVSPVKAGIIPAAPAASVCGSLQFAELWSLWLRVCGALGSAGRFL